MTDKELLALMQAHLSTKEFDALTREVGPYDITEPRFTMRQLVSALRQQDLARMARMREALLKVRSPDERTENYRLITEALSETSDIQDWMDGQRANAFDDAAKECREWESATKVLGICDRAEYQRLAYINVATVFSDMAAELRARSTKGEG